MMGKQMRKSGLSESETVELKKSTSELNEAVVSVVAILNKHQGGEVYFGVKNDRVVAGQDVNEKTLREVSRAISEHVEPKIYPRISKVVLEGKKCVRVEFRGQEVPYYAYGRSYMRVGDENRQLSAKELENIIVRKNRDKLRWDYEACKDAKMSDISSRKFKVFLKKAGLRFDSLENSLAKLGLLSRGRLLNAAVILFAKSTEKFFPNARLRCAVFGTSTAVTIDMQDFSGDLFYLIEKAEEYILKNIHVGMRLEGLYRVDVPEIDKAAFREAIINAFCHRDYYNYDSVHVAVFKDRLEIRSPGLLYGDLTIERIKRENVSERRNELIAEMFHKVHFIEKWGRGISLILSKEPTADFKEVGRQFVAVFKRKEVSELEGSATQKTTQKTTQRILALIGSNPQISRRELAAAVGISEDGIKFHLNNLKRKGVLKRIGPDKGGYWEVQSGGVG